MLASLAARLAYYKVHMYLVLVLLCGTLSTGLAAPVLAADPAAQPSGWVTNGAVRAMVQSDTTVYIGGDFTYVGPPTGSFSTLNQTTGAPNLTLPAANGAVYASVADGTGGWYIGGSFTTIGGLARNRLAHILADQTVDLAWNPGANDTVYALIGNGTNMYVGGTFTVVGGEERSGLAALNVASGSATLWNPSPDSTVYALVVSGSTLYAGGDFSTIGGQTRNRLAALDTTSGNATAWDPNANNTVYTLAVSGSTVYAGGNFTRIGADTRLRLAAIDASDTATNWNPVASNSVRALTIVAGTAYIGGDFSTIAGVTRNRLAAISISTSVLAGWNPNADSTVRSLVISGSTAYVGGDFTTVGGQPRNRLAALDNITGLATAWNPSAGGAVYTLAVSGSSVVVGGNFVSVGGQVRNRLAALDATSGVFTAWNPNADGGVYTLAMRGSAVYAGGEFATIDGEARNNLAALDAISGAPTVWDPNADGGVYALATNDTAVYVGGSFSSIGGQTRNNLAAIDNNAAATEWEANADAAVRAIAITGSVVYVGGDFTLVGEQTRNRLAALDISSAMLADWNPNADNTVQAIVTRGTTIYAGGDFVSIDGQVRNRLAALNATSGAPLVWNPNADDTVRALALRGDTLYAGGDFATIGGQARNYLAALDTIDGAATTWATSLDGSVAAVAVNETLLAAGGTFVRVAGSLHPFAAILGFPQPTVAPTATTNAATNVNVAAVTLNGTVNAEDSRTTVTFQITSTSGDYSGATILSGTPTIVDGTTTTTVSANFVTGLPNTVYFYRVVATNRAGTTTGTEQQVTTAAHAPTAATTSASLRGMTATLSGIVNAQNSATSVSFEVTSIDSDFSSATIVVASPSSLITMIDTAVTADVTNLMPNTIYFYRVVATNQAGMTNGAAGQFSTVPGVPIATTSTASQVATSAATLNGLVNAQNSTTTVRFQVTQTEGDYADAIEVVANPAVVSDNQTTAVSAKLASLIPNTIYYYRVVATNQAGVAPGVEYAFMTVAPPPTVTTNAASDIDASTATLRGTANAQNSATRVYFLYTRTPGNYDSAVEIAASSSNLTGTSDTAVSASITNLLPNTDYYYQIVATSPAGTTYGSEQRLTTAPVSPVATTLAASDVTTTSVTFNGMVNAQNSIATAYFQYSAVSGDYSSAIEIAANPIVIGGRLDTTVQASLINLEPNTTYYIRLVASNTAGRVTGVERRFTTAMVVPTISVPATLQTIRSGQLVVLHVDISGSGPMIYQWYEGPSGDTSMLLRGATDSLFTTPALMHTTSYWVRATNAGGTTDSLTIRIQVMYPTFLPLLSR
ncbi:MAG: hypothetical protein H7Z42_10270 [Roseiflexaceae bacterium]|nr:hypothetical protein [Roseiflexaceae bacterium]